MTRRRDLDETQPIDVLDLPTASRPIPIPVHKRAGYRPGAPTRRPKTDTAVTW